MNIKHFLIADPYGGSFDVNNIGVVLNVDIDDVIDVQYLKNRICAALKEYLVAEFVIIKEDIAPKLEELSQEAYDRFVVNVFYISDGEEYTRDIIVNETWLY